MSLLERSKNLTEHHLIHNDCYKAIVGDIDTASINDFADLPFISVRLFKHLNLSNDTGLITFESSGTQGAKSRFGVSKEDSIRQSYTLARVCQQFLGPKFDFGIFLQTNPAESRSDLLSANIAAIKGFQKHCKKSIVVTDAQEFFSQLIKMAETEYRILIFGFTAPIYTAALSIDELPINNCNLTVLHGGGWKKVEGVSDFDFNNLIRSKVGYGARVLNYYGTIEQVGSVFFKCTHGWFHGGEGSMILARGPSGEPLSDLEPGLLQLISDVPHSYPGHSILTDDIARVSLVHDCDCGTVGPRFEFLGRLPKAETRGCSDAY